MLEKAANPFRDDVFEDLPANLPGIEGLHGEVFSFLVEEIERLQERGPESASGRLFLVKGSEAGFGKSHLVARVRHHFAATVPGLTLPFDPSRPVTWPVVLSSCLRQFSAASLNSPTAPAPHSLLDEGSSRFLARLVMEALWSGSTRARECPVEVSRLAADPLAAFSPNPGSPLLDWLDRHVVELAQSPGMDLPRRLGLSGGEVSFWARLFLDRTRREENALDRLRGLSNGEARERLLQLLRIVTDHRVVLVVADHLDGFHRSPTAGMEIAEILNGIRERVSRCVVLVCVNDDLWNSVFADRLPSAWRDRLDGEPLTLAPMGSEAARALVEWRLRRLALAEPVASCFAQRLAGESDWHSDPSLSPRKVLRQARALWRREGPPLVTSSIPPVDEATPSGDEDAPPVDEVSSPGHDTAAIRGVPPRSPSAWRSLQGDETPSEDEAPPSRPPGQAAPPASDEFGFAGFEVGELAEIESIIEDIRGSGRTVVSEAPDSRFVESPDESSPLRPVEAAATAVPLSTSVGPVAATGQASPSRKASPSKKRFASSGHQAPGPVPVTAATLHRSLAEAERELLEGPALLLDLDRLAAFIREMGAHHPGLVQKEERHPGGRSACLRWTPPGQSVVTGFESPRNHYFWIQLLQRSLAANRPEKIAAFSHPSEPFDPSLFSSAGFSPAAVRHRVDIIEMNDRELAMIYASDQTLRAHADGPASALARQLVAHHLDPLWRRLIQPL